MKKNFSCLGYNISYNFLTKPFGLRGYEIYQRFLIKCFLLCGDEIYYSFLMKLFFFQLVRVLQHWIRVLFITLYTPFYYVSRTSLILNLVTLKNPCILEILCLKLFDHQSSKFLVLDPLNLTGLMFLSRLRFGLSHLNSHKFAHKFQI